jgi:hypothetical protein
MKMQRSSFPADYNHRIGLYECPLSAKSGFMPGGYISFFPSGVFVQLMKFYTTLFRNPLTRLKDDNVTHTMLVYRPTFGPTTSG